MRKYSFFMLLFLAATSAWAQTAITESTVTFKIKNLGIMTDGKFAGATGTIIFDPENLQNAVIEAAIDASTINTDNNRRDKHLKEEKYFDVEKHPQIIMKSVSFKRKGDNYTGKFNLTIKGITKSVDLPFTYTRVSGKGEFNGTFKINRNDFNVGSSSMVLGNEVTLNVSAVAAN